MDNNTSLQQLGFAWFSLIKDQAKLFALESELAHISLFPLLMSGLALALFSITLWITLLITLGYGIYVYQNNVWISLLTIFMLNGIAIGLAFIKIKRYQQRMKFARTRESLRELLR